MTLMERVIVCATDLSDTARAALDEAIELAERLGSGRLYVLHVRETEDRIESIAGVVERTSEHETELLRLVNEEIARAGQSRGRAPKLDVVTQIRHGKPYREILRFALEMNADLLVLGTHGRSGFGHALLGSVAERITRKAPCDVIVVKAPEVRAHLARVLREPLAR